MNNLLILTNRSYKYFRLPLILLTLLNNSLVAAPPVVTNLTANQRPGTKLVDIIYDVSADASTVNISLEISSDGGASFTVPTNSLSGAIGEDVDEGTGRTIIWDAGVDWNQNVSETMQFRITVDDGLNTYLISDEFANIPRDNLNNINDFFIGKYEVTNELWRNVQTWAVSNGYSDLSEVSSTLYKGDNYPNGGITWTQAIKWCNARSEMEGLAPCYYDRGSIYRTGMEYSIDYDSSANGYRLPSSAEWEWAARGGLIGKRFPWGDTISHNEANYNSHSSITYDVSSTRGYHPNYDEIWPYQAPVGSFPPNGYGLYEVAGNVGEWCFDSYDETGLSKIVRSSHWSNNARGMEVERVDSLRWDTGTTGLRLALSSAEPSGSFGFAEVNSSVDTLTLGNINDTGPGADLSNSDLSNADLSNAYYPGANFSGADLSGADLSGADLSNAVLVRADLSNANISGANLTGALISGADLSGADLSNAILNAVISANNTGSPSLPINYQMVSGYIVGPFVNLSDADLRYTDLSNVNFNGSNLSNASLENSVLNNVISGNVTGSPTLPMNYKMVEGYIVGPYVNLSSANLNDAGLHEIDLTNAVLIGADLTNANLNRANLNGANLNETSLTGAHINYADLSNSNLTGVDLSNASLEYANLYGAELSDAVLSNVQLDGVKSGNIIGQPTTLTGRLGGKFGLRSGYIVGRYVDLSNASLKYANLSGLNLDYADFTDADVSGANFKNSTLLYTDFTNAIWSDVISQSDFDAVVSEREAALAAQASAEAERDARPTEAAYDAVVTERDAKLTLDEVKDLRAGSKMIEIHNGQATLSMEVEQSDDLDIWTNGGTASVQINVQPGEDKKFFRFKMDDSDSSSDETGVEIPLSYVDLVVNLSSEGSYDFISVSNHPLNDYNGVYYTQPDLINNMPYFKSGNQKYLYFYKGASGGLFSWSFYNALPDGISDLFTGGWIHPYPVLETGNFNIFEVEAE
jgi:uncharacterized protein YjbI with pentapeptide repeats/formylglycine-generating enzyme required for sulfatase activity